MTGEGHQPSKDRFLTPADRTLFVSALSEFRSSGESGVLCDVCQTAIQFEDRMSATVHWCKCGKFNGTLRGL